MATVAVSEKTRKLLLEVAADLQKSRGERVDFDQAIHYLATRHRRGERREELFLKFCGSVRGSFDEFYRELVRGRGEDEG